MNIAPALAGIGTGIASYNQANRDYATDEYTKTIRDLGVQQAKLHNAALIDQAEERGMKLSLERRQEAFRKDLADHLAKAGPLPGLSDEQPSGSMGTPPTGSPAEATTVSATGGGPLPTGGTPGGASMQPQPKGAKARATIYDTVERFRVPYELALKHQLPEQAMAVRDAYLGQQQALVKDRAARAARSFMMSGDPTAVIKFYNEDVPDGNKITSFEQDATDPRNPKYVFHLQDGSTKVHSRDELGIGILAFADSQAAAKLYSTILEERVKGAEARATEGVKAEDAKKLQEQKDKASGQRTATTAAATVKAAGIRSGALVEAAKIRASAAGGGPGAKEDAATEKAAKDAGQVALALFKTNPLGGIDEEQRPQAQATMARASQLARVGWDPRAAADQAIKEWQKAVATAGGRGAPKMPSEPLPPPPGKARKAGAAATAAASGVPTIDSDFTTDDEE